MSSGAASREIESLRATVLELQARIIRLEHRVAELEGDEAEFAVVDLPAGSTEEVGLFLRRCLNGEPRGTSSRDRLQLASRPFVKQGSDCGDSIFVGLPTKGDIKKALLAGDGLDGSSLFVYDGEASDADYVVGTLKVKTEEEEADTAIEVIFVCDIDGKCLAAVPQAAWNRKAQNRKLPPGALGKATAVEVAAAALESRGVVANGVRMKIWLGFLDPGLEALVSFEGEAGAVDVAFAAVGGGSGYLPHSDALVEVAKDKFQFHTASEHPQQDEPVKHSLEARMAKMEEAVVAMSTSIKALAAAPPAVAAPAKAERTRMSETSRPAAAAPDGSGLDPGVVRSAVAAGLDPESIQDMARLIGGNQARLLRDKPVKAAKPKTVLEESEDDEVEDEPRGAGTGEIALPVETSDPVATAVLKLTALVEDLHQQKSKRGSKLEQALDSAGGSGSTSEGAGVGSRKNSLARRALRAALHESPEEIYSVVERLMLEDLTSRTLVPGMPRPELSARAWLESRSRLQNFPAAVRHAWGTAGILDALIANRPKEARARACLMILQADQVAVDRGGWALAAEASLELPPPFHQFAAHITPDPTEQPMSRLMDPRWGEIFLQHIKETDDYIDRRRKHGSRQSGHGNEGQGEDAPGDGPPGVKVPGAGAPTIRVAALVNSLPRKVLDSSCSFSSFFAGLCRKPQKNAEVTSSFWPMPLPYPEVIQSGSGGGGCWSKRLVNLAVAVMNWLHLGRPRCAPSGLEAGVPLSKRQWGMVQLLAGLVGDGDFSFVLEPADLGRTAAKLEDQDAILGAIHRAVLSLEVGAPAYLGPRCSFGGSTADHFEDRGCAGPPFPTAKPFGWMCGKLRGKKLTNAKAIQADRISMPPAPSFDPVPFLDPKTADVYQCPLAHRLQQPREPPPLRSVVMASRFEKLELFKKLARSGRLGILSTIEVSSGITSGMFCVTKDMDRDRLILDGRGANVYEIPLNHWTKQLASAEKVAGIYLAPGFSLLASGRDLKDFFLPVQGASLMTNPSKAFQNQTKAKFWGIELDGIRGVIRPATSRLLSIMDLIFAAGAGDELDRVVRLSPELKAELWCLVRARRRSQRHRRSRESVECAPPPPGLLDGAPLGFPLRQFLLPSSAPDFGAPGCLDLFSGSGGLARALVRCGAPWVLTFDTKHGPEQDVLQEPLRSKIFGAVRGGLFRIVSMAPPVGTLSTSVSPRCRSRTRPLGHLWLRGATASKVAAENELARFCVDMISACVAAGLGWSLEHPDSSFLWRLPGFEAYANPLSTEIWRGDMCTFGTPWRKRTRLATSLELRGGRRFCRCRHPHVLLRGRVPGRPDVSRASVAKPYPRGFAQAVAFSACRSGGWCDPKGKLELSDCARCGSRRIGEAKNPGPRRGPRARVGDLESRPLQTAATLRYEDRLWEDFVTWSSSCLSDPCLVFSLVPAFCAMALRAYSNDCFGRGKTLSSFRHTIIAAQKRILGVKPFLSMAWEMVSRWEALEPPVHRCPIPEPLVKSMVFLAWAWKMERWGAITLLAFYGLARIGEVLKCRRRDLLLPGDLLDDDSRCIFLNLRESKTSTRGRPKVQHTRVSDARAVELIERAFVNLDAEDLLWPSSPSTYRYRWDFLLRQLDVPRGLALTPGGLRGGGAVQRYRLGVTPGELQWAMRLKHISTLEHYLQELAAVTALTEVSDHGRSRIKTAARLYDMA
ncbi:unnamed protein product [Symbiodinium necroappetens]|uniref:Tyr recombinase domain-containing protein n=1 Tax=Symbiodinium necroappetens TaxID=1628268 RepID=A0A812T2C3_9DINO|nr:unnamed protein product [Symbiodinium necroappetens]